MVKKKDTERIHIDESGFTEHDIEITLLNPAQPIVQKEKNIKQKQRV